MGQQMPRRKVSGEGRLAGGRVNERRDGLDDSGETEDAGSAAFLVRVRLRPMMLALPFLGLHLGAAISLGHFEAGHLAG